MLLATWTLWIRDIVRFYRQRSRIVGALATPVVFWLLLGSGLGRSFRLQSGMPLEGGYLQYFFPGTITLIVLFTAIFSTISVIEDRQEGFLQGVLVAPVPRSAIVLGKILGGATLALFQAVLFLLLAPFAHVHLALAALPVLGGILIVMALALTGLGFLIAWLLESTQGFHAIMNLLLIPMWMLSGALFPESGAAGWIRFLMLANPLTYGVSALTRVMGTDLTGPPMALSIGVMIAFAVAMLVAGTIVVRRPLSR